jgi:hypothetical protein
VRPPHGITYNMVDRIGSSSPVATWEETYIPGEKKERKRSWNDAAPFCGGGRVIGADREPGVLETNTWMACIHAIYFAFDQMERGQAEKVLRLPYRVLIIARSSQPFPRRSRPWDPRAHYLRTGWLVH